ncbi:solanesyl diphosphate synthase 3 [Populus alba x Populus x berolinensis]|nr:solanesyl diphosphate synthase 3 [Populus alba x Populus x berolinensis]
MEEFPQLRSVIDWGFDKPENIDVALEYLGKSRGIQRTRELAAKHANLAAAAIDSLPETDDEEVRKSRRALVDLTQRSIPRFVIRELVYKGARVPWLYNRMIQILFSVLTSTGADANIPFTEQ